MLLCLLIVTLALLGFGYIIWVLASKESGWVRLAGQILSVALKICVLIMFILVLVYGCWTKGICHKCGMTDGQIPGKKMEHKMLHKSHEMMNKCKECMEKAK
jgi:hypothetical protein